jgi:bacillithiol biosynthesis cysteine-adding enzyme BshC
MFYSYPFSSLTGFSKLFIDFFGSKSSFFSERFPSNSLLLSSESYIEKRAKNFEQRKALLELIQNSCKEISFSKEQALNFNMLSKDNTLVVVAGQQPGFLGGPLFVLYKSLSAIYLSFKLNEIYPNFNFVPIFWVEDNDHDSYEASQIYSLDTNNKVVHFSCCSDCKKTDRIPISEKTFNKEIGNVINNFLDISNGFAPNPELHTFIAETYKTGERWSSSFVKTLSHLLCEYGILFIRSSIARKMGLFTPIITKEIENFGQSNSLVENANNYIDSSGYHIQAKTSVINLFFHKGIERHKILWDSGRHLYQIGKELLRYDELVQLVRSESPNFSPNVLLRPICQDWITPNIASIVGPSELGYSTQLKELYQWFEVHMPAIIPRHSLTILSSSLLKEQNLVSDIVFYLQPMSNIETILFQKFRDRLIQEAIEKSYHSIQQTFAELKEAAMSLDKSLENSADSHSKKVMNIMEDFAKKLISAEKRKLYKEIAPHLNINSWVYPNGSLQERMLTLLFPFSIFTHKEFFKKIEAIFARPNNAHYVILL